MLRNYFNKILKFFFTLYNINHKTIQERIRKSVKEKGFQAHVVVVRAFYLVEERYKYWRACVYCTSTDNIVRPEIRDQSQ